MKKLGLLFGMLAMLAPSAHAQSGISDGEVRIGLITDMSSIYREVGYVADIAAQMAIEDFGGTVLGRPVRVLVRDHELNPEVGLAHARDLHENHNVDAFLEMVGTNVAVGIQQYAAQNNILAIHTGSGGAVLTGRACSPVGVHWVFDTYAMAAGTATAITQQGGRNWFFITADYSFGELLERDARAAIERHGGQVVGRTTHSPGARDFTSQLLEAQVSGADVIALANAGDDLTMAVRQAYELGMMDGDQQVAGLMATESLPQQVGLYVAAGLQMTTAFYWNMDDETRAWSRRFRERTGQSGTMFSAGLYSAVTHYLRAIEAAGTDDARQVIAKMRELPVNDVFARNGRLRQDGRMVHDMYLAEVIGPTESAGIGDYVRIVDTIPGDQAFRALEEGGCPHLSNGG